MIAAQAHGLTKHYGHGRRGPLRGSVVRALEDLTIEVREGEIFGFLGPNGAGKSTLIRLLLGFLHPTAGEAAVLGLDIVSQGVEIRRRVGYLPGGIALYDGMSGQALLDYLASLYRRPTPLRAELVERLELSERTLRRPVRDYSRGMRQKIGIIQALQHDPELAILDEPTEGLDPLMQRVFYDILEEQRRAGRTIFFSSHVLSEVERVCDRVAFVRRGHLVALQDVGSLLAHRRRNVEMRLYGPAPDLAGVAGVSGLVVRDDMLHCQLEGDVGPFLAAIARAAISDLTIEPAHLEEAFLELYADEEPEDEEDDQGEPMTASASSSQGGPVPATAVDDSIEDLLQPEDVEPETVEPEPVEPEPAGPAAAAPVPVATVVAAAATVAASAAPTSESSTPGQPVAAPVGAQAPWLTASPSPWPASGKPAAPSAATPVAPKAAEPGPKAADPAPKAAEPGAKAAAVAPPTPPAQADAVPPAPAPPTSAPKPPAPPAKPAAPVQPPPRPSVKHRGRPPGKRR